MSIGRFVGTTSLLAPVRASALESRDGTDAGGTVIQHKVDDVVSKLHGLHRGGRGWQPVAVFRGQDKLSPEQPIDCHGFALVELQRDSAKPKFLRFDWWQEGLTCQEADSLDSFMNYASLTAPTGIRPEVITAAAATATAASGTAAAAAVRTLTAYTVVAETSIILGIAGVTVAAVAAVIGRGGVPTGRWVRLPEGATKTLLMVADALELNDKPYDVRSWNCNHVADLICAILVA